MTARSVGAIASYELRRQLWTPAAPLIALFLTGYNIIYSSQAEALAELGAAGVAANANYVVYLFSVGSCFWLLFLLVHMAAVSITRDIGQRFAEITLSVPVSFRGILLGKVLGATLAALVIATAIPLSWVATSFLLPPDRVGPIPWRAMGHVYLLFIVPMVVASMALYFSVAARFGRAAPAYGVAFACLVVWMLGVTVLFDGGVNRLVAQWIDPIGWVTVLAQVEQWTAAERLDRVLAVTREVIINRASLLGLALGVLAHTLATARPERWLGSGSRRPRAPADIPGSTERTTTPPVVVVTSFGRLATLRALATCSRIWLKWQLATGAARVLCLFSLLSMIGGGWAHVLHGSDGMKWPWTGFALPRMFEIVYLPTALYLCFAAGQMVFRERNDNFAEVFDVTPRPRWLLAAPRIVALIGLATVFALLLAVGILAVQLLFAPATFDPIGAAGLSLLLAWPAFVELGAIAFFVYVVFRREWLAHGLAFFGVFILVVNHEIGVVEHPLLQYAIPLHAEISPLTGWRPWLRPLLAIGTVHLSIAALLYLFAMISWPRGFALTWRARVGSAVAETPWAIAGSIAGCAVLAIISSATVGSALHDAGEDGSLGEERARSAAYEQTFRDAASSAELVTAQLVLHLHPRERSIDIVYTATLENPTGDILERIDLDLPEDFEVLSVEVDGRAPAGWERNTELRHDIVRPEQPVAPQGRVELRVSGRIQHGALSFAPTHVPIERAGAWVNAAAVTPRIGYVRERELASPSERAQHGLGPRLPLPPSSSRYAYGSGSTRTGYEVTVSAPDDYALVMSGAAAVHAGEARIRGQGPIHFAVAALSRTETTHLSSPGATTVHVLAHQERRTHASGILDRGVRVLAHLESRLGDTRLEALWIVHCPRATMPVALYDNVLMLPDEAAWDYAPNDPAFDAPLFQVASALAQRWFVEGLRPREVPGHAALAVGLPLAVALDALSELRSPRVAAAHRDEVEQSVLRDIASAASDLRPPELAETPVEGRIAGLALHGLRQHHGSSAFDALVRELSRGDAPSMTTFTATLDRQVPGSRSLMRTITAIDGSILRVAYSPEHSIVTETAAPAFSYAEGRWQPLARLPIPVRLSVRGGSKDDEILEATAWGGMQTFDVSTEPASIEIDPKRVFLDRNRRDNRMPVVNDAR
jgi:hypothetical protein